MKNMHSEWRDRLKHWLETLKKDLYLPLGEIEIEGFVTAEELTPAEAARGPFVPMTPGTPWGRTWEYCWMRGRITLPEAAAGKRIVLDLPTGGESTVYVDGRAFGTCRAAWVEVPHQHLVDNFLPGSGEPGRSYDLLIEAYAGHDFPRSPLLGCGIGPVLPGTEADWRREGIRTSLGRMTYGVWNEEAYQLYLDLNTLALLGEETDPESLRADRIAAALERATLMIDFEQEPEARLESYRAARAYLREALEARNGTTAPVFYAVGHAHLDLAWLWPMAETRRKTSRTFAQQLRLMEAYPEYKYLQSQPAAYEMCRERDPELFERIREAARQGQWIPEGAMWVEPDTNMPAGESLIRQLIHGKRYFREMFGVDSVVLWLPDTFGYSAALPQILKKAGVRYLVTQKIFWTYNEGEVFPYHSFTWQGADGTEILSFLPTGYSYQTDPREVIQTWRKRVQKRDLDVFLYPFGYGDGGGGPTRDHLEYLRRETDLEGMPRMIIEGPVRFFEHLEAEGGPKHTYTGELYFSAHRGVLTSQAAVKRGNRKAETALREAECWGTLAMTRGAAYPLARMDRAWKLLLLNQFHDILPGSSIGRVYEETRRDHRRVIAEAGAVREEALRALTEEAEGVTVFNSLSFERAGLVELPETYADGAVTDRGERVPVERIDGTVHALVRVPACGAVSLRPDAGPADFVPARVRRTETGAVLENEWVRAELNGRGEVVSFRDQKTGREFAAGPMNRLLLYKDVPRRYDAWDLDSTYLEQPVPLGEDAVLTVREGDGLRAAVHLSRRFGHSVLEQEIVLEAGSRRLDFVTEADWHELHRLLKADFPVAVRTTDGINEIQFGYLKRPTHRSRPYDADRFEVCNHRYSALCDESHGAAVLNDCKYGISMHGNALRLSLLRAPASPEMRADNRKHHFTYAFTTWEGSFLDSPVVREAYALNVPLCTVNRSGHSFSALAPDRPNIFIDTVKPAEDGSGDWIVRLYEAKRADTVCRLRFSVPARRIWDCDLLENKGTELEGTDSSVSLHFHPFEIKTLRMSVSG